MKKFPYSVSLQKWTASGVARDNSIDKFIVDKNRPQNYLLLISCLLN